ncbi:MAG: DeoR family transcriptional regulator [Lentisphaerae bacterium]|nr:DeoR family transcriptional regulator [Lentisphaerota bacterium]
MTDEKTDGPQTSESEDASTNPPPSVAQRAMEGKPAESHPFNELSVLFPLLSLYTAGYLGLMAAEFFLHAVKVPAGMMPVYVALLGAYAADKEIRRWAGTPEPSRRGTVFVHLWMVFFLAAWLIHAFRPEFQLPGELGVVVLQVLGIFFGSKASKYIWEGRREEADPVVKSDRESRVLELLKVKGRLTRKEVMTELDVSHNTAFRLLAGLEEKGLVRRMGDNKNTFYEPTSLPSQV